MRAVLVLLVTGFCFGAVGCAGLVPTPFPAVPAHPEGVVNNRYLASSLVVGGAQKPLVPDTADGNAQLELDFGKQGLSLSACNGTAFDDWSVNDGRLLVKGSGQGWTLIACPADAAAQDHWFGNFVSSGPEFATTENGITLTAGDTQIPFVLTPDSRYP